MQRLPEEQKSLGRASPYCSQQVRRTDQCHNPGGQFTDIIGDHIGGRGRIRPKLHLGNSSRLPTDALHCGVRPDLQLPTLRTDQGHSLGGKYMDIVTVRG